MRYAVLFIHLVKSVRRKHLFRDALGTLLRFWRYCRALCARGRQNHYCVHGLVDDGACGTRRLGPREIFAHNTSYDTARVVGFFVYARVTMITTIPVHI